MVIVEPLLKGEMQYGYAITHIFEWSPLLYGTQGDIHVLDSSHLSTASCVAKHGYSAITGVDVLTPGTLHCVVRKGKWEGVRGGRRGSGKGRETDVIT